MREPLRRGEGRLARRCRRPPSLVPGPERAGGTTGRSAGKVSFPTLAGDDLDHDIQVTQVPGVLLEQVEQDPLQGRRVGADPAFTGLAHLGQIVGGDDGPAPRGLAGQVGQEAGQRLVRADGPAVAVAIAPRVADVAALESPLQPAQLDVAQVLGQLQRRPAGRESAAAEFGGGLRSAALRAN